ncbi:TVP38/TMEM64 family protein [Solidesulfovibrio magneticus]|nr:VTT domain-containing protein [Solidesulfovibrio magneticus]
MVYPAPNRLYTRIFLVLYAGLVLAMVPTLTLNLAGGFHWGGGGLLSAFGASLGSFIAFFVTRYAFGDILEKYFANALVDRTQRDLAKNSWQCVAFLRVNPAIPTGPLNYFLGLTAVDPCAYLFFTAVFSTPPSTIVVWIGLETYPLLCKAHQPHFGAVSF